MLVNKIWRLREWLTSTDVLKPLVRFKTLQAFAGLWTRIFDVFFLFWNCMLDKFAFISLCSFLLLLFFSFFVFQGDVVMQNFYNNFFSKISLKTFVWRKIQLISSSRDILKSVSLTYQLYRVKSNAVWKDRWG